MCVWGGVFAKRVFILMMEVNERVCCTWISPARVLRHSVMSESLKDDRALKIVLLGAPCVGKSTFANRIHTGFFRETYYPTLKSTKLLFDFKPDSAKAQSILDENGSLQSKQLITKNDDILLSPVIFQSYNRSSTSSTNNIITSNTKKSFAKNSHYSFRSQQEQSPKPADCPIQIELIDTPPFKPHLVVPFLEVSLYRNLDKEDLHNLANEPRRPVSTNPLLVASGAGDLDGKVNGYIFTYCAVPSMNPPSYDESLTPTSTNDQTEEEERQLTNPLPNVSSMKKTDNSLAVLEVMRYAIFDAWKEFRTYQKKMQKGAEGDIYSLLYGIRQLWKMKTFEDEQRKLEELRKISTHLDDLNIDPSSPDCPPPIIIMCTHAKHDGASPLLIEKGRKLASEWKSSFILVDNEFNVNVEETLALMIREIVEREKLQRASAKKKW